MSKRESSPDILVALTLQASVLLLLVVNCSRKRRRRRAALGATRYQLVYLIRREADVDESMAVKMLMLSALETNLARIGLIVLVLLSVCHHDSGIKVAAREREKESRYGVQIL